MIKVTIGITLVMIEAGHASLTVSVVSKIQSLLTSHKCRSSLILGRSSVGIFAIFQIRTFREISFWEDTTAMSHFHTFLPGRQPTIHARNAPRTDGRRRRAKEKAAVATVPIGVRVRPSVACSGGEPTRVDRRRDG